MRELRVSVSIGLKVRGDCLNEAGRAPGIYLGPKEHKGMLIGGGDRSHLNLTRTDEFRSRKFYLTGVWRNCFDERSMSVQCLMSTAAPHINHNTSSQVKLQG